GSSVKKYAPDSLVTIVREKPVSTFDTVTVAPGTRACDVSVTVPRRLAGVRWVRGGVASRRTAESSPRDRFQICIGLPSLSRWMGRFRPLLRSRAACQE